MEKLTQSGYSRIAQLFLDDIKHLEYKQDGVTKTKEIDSSSIQENKVILLFKINNNETGTFSEFKLKSKSDINYIEKALSFTKGNDEVMLEFPVTFLECV